jgi:hypothetical protein
LFRFAYATTFRVDDGKDRSTLIRKWNDCGVSPCAPLVSAEGVCCNCCHANKPVPKTSLSAAQSVDKHFKINWPKYEYHPKEGDRIRFMDSNAYVIKRRGRLVLYEGKKQTLLPIHAKIIKAGKWTFIL